jgi:hypothetical protein
MFTVRSDSGSDANHQWDTYKAAKSYAVTASLMFSAVFTVYKDGDAIAHIKDGRLIYHV